MQYDNKLLLQTVIRLEPETFTTFSRDVRQEQEKLRELMFSAANILQKKS